MSSVTKSPVSKNRNPIKQWSITFPDSKEVTKGEFLTSFPPYDEAVCAMEEHQDGTPHLHLGIKLKKGISKSKLLLWIKEKYPSCNHRIHVQATRNKEDWESYLRKEDPNPLVVREAKKSKDYEKIIRDLEEDQRNNHFPQEWDEDPAGRYWRFMAAGAAERAEAREQQNKDFVEKTYAPLRKK